MISLGSDCTLLVPVEAAAVIPLWVCNEVKYSLGVIQRYQVNCLVLRLRAVQRKEMAISLSFLCKQHTSLSCLALKRYSKFVAFFIFHLYKLSCHFAKGVHFTIISINWHILVLFLTRQNVCGPHNF